MAKVLRLLVIVVVVAGAAGGIYAWVNLIGLLIQMFIVSRIFKFLGVRLAVFVLPCIAIGGYALLVAFPLLATVRLVKIAENATDYSLS